MIASSGGETRQCSIDRNISNTNPNMDNFLRAKRPRVQRHLVEDHHDVNKTSDSLCQFVASVPKLFPTTTTRSDYCTLEKVISNQSTATTKTTILQPLEVFPKKRQQQHHGRRVTFGTPLVSTYIPHVFLHDDDDDNNNNNRKSNWYSRRELEQIEETCMETIRFIQSGKLIYEDDDEHCKRGLESRISISLQTTTQTGGRQQLYHHDYKQENCAALVTSKSSSSSTTTTIESKEDIISAVLDAQIDMWSSGITSRNDEEYQLEQHLYETYKMLSSHHGFKAIVRGLQDWRAVVNDYDYYYSYDYDVTAGRSDSNVNWRTSTSTSTTSLMNEISRIASASASAAAAGPIKLPPSSIFV